MRQPSRSRLRQRGTALWLYSLLLMTVIIPMVGLAIDLTLLYTVQAKLVTAVDGAVLGAGRLIGTTANPPEIAGEFLRASFPAGYWSTPPLTLTSDMTNSTPNTYNVVYDNPAPPPGSHIIDVRATVQVPLLFMRVLGYNTAKVSASAEATRRSSRIVLVLDRSGSIAGSTWSTLQSAAIGFASKFTPGVDQLGLVVFGTTGVVAYPNYSKPYNFSVTSDGGPDHNFIDTATDPNKDGSHCCDMLYMMKQATTGGATGMAEGLDLAYLELQKAHMRDMAAGTDDRLNTIVFFTDGIANQVPIYANNPAYTGWMKPACSGRQTLSCSMCTYNPATVFSGNNDNRMIFMVGPPQDTNSPSLYGLFQNGEIDKGSTLTWVQEKNSGSYDMNSTTTTSGAQESIQNTTSISNCTNIDPTQTKSGQYWNGTKYVSYTFPAFFDMNRIPAVDAYGTSTEPRPGSQDSAAPGYKNSTAPGFTYKTWDNTQVRSAYYWGVAAWTTTDNIGYLMRTDANYSKRAGDTKPMTIQIYTVGYKPSGGVDDGLLLRLANDPLAAGYDPHQPAGHYYQAYKNADISSALDDIASSLLRLQM
jgi:hypothetical protein